MYKLLSGAKSVKQYRGDENLPEAKKGMKNCGCKHSKSKYKYQKGSEYLESNKDYMDYLLEVKNSIPVSDRTKKIRDYLSDSILLDRYKNTKTDTSFNMDDEDSEIEETSKSSTRSQDKGNKPSKDKTKVYKRTGVAGTRHSFKFKEGTGALTIPEGSAIVTANGGKNKQALMAYKQGNYKLLNNIIDDMPEDRVSKKQDGAYDLYSDERISEKFGQKYDIDKPKYRSSVRGGKLNVVEDINNKKYRDKLRSEPEYLKEEMKKGNVVIDEKGNITYKPIGASSKNKMEFLGTSKPKEGGVPTGGDIPKDGDIPTPILPPEKTTEETPKKKKKFGEFPSLAEVAAKSSILGQGVEGVPENYLKLGRYEYASQLPKTLQEIQLAEQAGKETSRDIAGGDAGRYLAQSGNLSAARMKAANDAVIQDTLARQDILNKNVDLGNVEAQTNTALKNQFAMQRAANRGAYNNMLVSLGQSIDTAADASKLMANQKEADEQRIQVLKDAAKSGNYQWKQDGSTLSLVPKKKGAKRLKTYKRK